MPPMAVRRSTCRSRSWRKPERCGSAPGSRLGLGVSSLMRMTRSSPGRSTRTAAPAPAARRTHTRRAAATARSAAFASIGALACPSIVLSSALSADGDGGPARLPRRPMGIVARGAARRRRGAAPSRRPVCHARRPPSPQPGGSGTARTPGSCGRRPPSRLAASSGCRVIGARVARGAGHDGRGSVLERRCPSARASGAAPPCISASGTVWQRGARVLLDARPCGASTENCGRSGYPDHLDARGPGERRLGAEPRVRARSLRALGDVAHRRRLGGPVAREHGQRDGQRRRACHRAPPCRTGRSNATAGSASSAWHWRQFTRAGCDDRISATAPGPAWQARQFSRIWSPWGMGGGLPAARRDGSAAARPCSNAVARNDVPAASRGNVALAAAHELGMRHHGRVGAEPRRPAAIGVTGQTGLAAALRIVHLMRDDRWGAGIGPAGVVHGERPPGVRLRGHRRVVQRPVLPAKDAGLEGDRGRGLGAHGQQHGVALAGLPGPRPRRRQPHQQTASAISTTATAAPLIGTVRHGHARSTLTAHFL